MAKIDYAGLPVNYKTSVQRIRYGLWEKIYYPEVIRGLGITTWHFVRNMTIHTLHVFGWAKDKRGAVTYQWPEERRPIHRRLRGRHRLTKKPDGSEVERQFEATSGENSLSNERLSDDGGPGEYSVSLFIHVQYVDASGTGKILNNSAGSVELRK